MGLRGVDDGVGRSTVLVGVGLEPVGGGAGGAPVQLPNCSSDHIFCRVFAECELVGLVAAYRVLNLLDDHANQLVKTAQCSYGRIHSELLLFHVASDFEVY